MPNEATEADIIERYGWTYDELDNEDQDRVYTGFAIQNVRDSADRIRTWIDNTGKTSISRHDLELYGMLLDAEDECNSPKPEARVEGMDEFLAGMNDA